MACLLVRSCRRSPRRRIENIRLRRLPSSTVFGASPHISLLTYTSHTGEYFVASIPASVFGSSVLRSTSRDPAPCKAAIFSPTLASPGPHPMQPLYNITGLLPWGLFPIVVQTSYFVTSCVFFSHTLWVDRQPAGSPSYPSIPSMLISSNRSSACRKSRIFTTLMSRVFPGYRVIMLFELIPSPSHNGKSMFAPRVFAGWC